MEVLNVYRVPYGKPGLAMASREYKVKGFSAVGTISEIIKALKSNTITSIICYNNKGDAIEQIHTYQDGKWICKIIEK